MSIATLDKHHQELVEEASKYTLVDDKNLFSKIVISVGPSIFLDDSKDILGQKELQRIKDNFLVKKLKLSEDEDLENKFKVITQEFVVSGFKKERVFFYYFLVKRFQKEKIFINENEVIKSGFISSAISFLISVFRSNRVFKSKETDLENFGENFIKKQKDLDPDIAEIVDKNFSSLY